MNLLFAILGIIGGLCTCHRRHALRLKRKRERKAGNLEKYRQQLAEDERVEVPGIGALRTDWLPDGRPWILCAGNADRTIMNSVGTSLMCLVVAISIAG